MDKTVLNLFYDEVEADRWLPWDRYPRRIIRRLIRGAPRVGGQRRVFLNLCAGLDLLGVRYRINDYRHIKRHPEQPAGIVGRSHLLDRIPWRNPILLGASITGHPMDDVDLLKRLPVRRILVPGEWLRQMYEPYYGAAVSVWPVGIDTERWKPGNTRGGIDQPTTGAAANPASPGARQDAIGGMEGKATDFLIYDKVRWEHDQFEQDLIQPIRDELKRRRLSFQEIRYGFYQEEEFEKLLRHCKAMIFLCEHETQGIAYQQALSCGVPILAWDRGGFWQDPEFYPQRFKFQSVSSIPYWDGRCGVSFPSREGFDAGLDEFLDKLNGGRFAPREYVVENLSLRHCSGLYRDFYHQVAAEMT